jgi:hypothetical protein
MKETYGDFEGVDDKLLPAVEKAKINRWQPSGNKCDDELHLYDSGDMYDCTFKVGYQVRHFLSPFHILKQYFS